MTMTNLVSKDYQSIKEAVDMLKSKQLSAATIQNFGISYLSSKEKFKTDLIWYRLGLPIHDLSGNIIAYAGRKLESTRTDFEKAMRSKYLDQDFATARINKWIKSKWINEPYDKGRNLFNIHRAYKEILKKNYVILVEGYFDVMALYDNGIKNVVSPCGLTLSTNQILLLRSLCDNILVFYDGDRRGQDALKKCVEQIEELDIRAISLVLVNGDDPDVYINEVDAQYFINVVEQNIEKGTKVIKLI